MNLEPLRAHRGRRSRRELERPPTPREAAHVIAEQHVTRPRADERWPYVRGNHRAVELGELVELVRRQNLVLQLGIEALHAAFVGIRQPGRLEWFRRLLGFSRAAKQRDD